MSASQHQFAHQLLIRPTLRTRPIKQQSSSSERSGQRVAVGQPVGRSDRVYLASADASKPGGNSESAAEPE